MEDERDASRGVGEVRVSAGTGLLSAAKRGRSLTPEDSSEDKRPSKTIKINNEGYEEKPLALPSPQQVIAEQATGTLTVKQAGRG